MFLADLLKNYPFLVYPSVFVFIVCFFLYLYITLENTRHWYLTQNILFLLCSCFCHWLESFYHLLVWSDCIFFWHKFNSSSIFFYVWFYRHHLISHYNTKNINKTESRLLFRVPDGNAFHSLDLCFIDWKTALPSALVFSSVFVCAVCWSHFWASWVSAVGSGWTQTSASLH